MLRSVVFTVLSAFVVGSILSPAGQSNTIVAASLCPSTSTEEDAEDHESALESFIHAKMADASRLSSFKAAEEVYIRVDPESMACYEEGTEIALMSTVVLWWNDDTVCWDPDKFGGKTSTVVQGLDLWSPRLVSYSRSVDPIYLAFQMSDCTVNSNGTLGCFYTIALSGPCEMQLRHWPRASKTECWITIDIIHPEGRQKLLHRDDRSAQEWLSSAVIGSVGEFRIVDVKRETTDLNGVVFRFFLEGTTSPLADAVTTTAAVLSVIIAVSFALPAGSAPRMCLLGCSCLSLLLSIGFLSDQLVSVTPDTPVIVKLHCDILIVAALAVFPSTLLAPRLTVAKPLQWQLAVRTWLLGSAVGRFLLLIFRIPQPDDSEPRVDSNVSSGEDGPQILPFCKEDAMDIKNGRDPTRLMIYTLVDRLVAAVCCVCLISLWLAMMLS